MLKEYPTIIYGLTVVCVYLHVTCEFIARRHFRRNWATAPFIFIRNHSFFNGMVMFGTIIFATNAAVIGFMNHIWRIV